MHRFPFQRFAETVARSIPRTYRVRVTKTRDSAWYGDFIGDEFNVQWVSKKDSLYRLTDDNSLPKARLHMIDSRDCEVV